MLWPREEFHAAYGQIKHDGIQAGGCSILILVALDVDALCACEIVTSLLKADFLSYTLLAVKGYEDIVRIRAERIRDAEGKVRNAELRSVILINCGAIVNVHELLQLPETMRCYILDSHRPIHLANIYDPNQQIVVFDDGAQSLDDFPADGSDIDKEDFEVSEEEDEEEEEEEEEDEDDEGEAEFAGNEHDGEAEVDKNQETVAEDSKSMVDQDGEETEKENVGAKSDSSEKRKRSMDETDASGTKKLRETGIDALGMPSSDQSRQLVVEGDDGSVESTRAAKRHRREEILRYYRGSFYGAPAASIAFELAQQLNSSHRDLLWYAIIGLTKQFALEQIDADNYNLMVHRFQDEVLALDASLAGSGDMDMDSGTSVNPAYEHGKIAFEEEYRFMLYRHWSLYESMYYSDYVASKLGLWMDQARRFGARVAVGRDGSSGEGETALHVFLARMGFSLKQSQQKFTYMPLEMKERLRDKVSEIAPEFGLDDLFYGSFKRYFAFQYQLCAADAVYGLQALLEAPEGYIANVFKVENHHQTQQNSAWAQFFSTTSDRAKPQKGDQADENSGDESDFQPFWQQNFILAHTALSCRSVESSKLMESGIKVAMELKQAIVRVGISIMERKLIIRVKHFRYVCVNIPEREQELFANANVLTQLALFLLNVHRASGKWGLASRQRKAKDGGDDGTEDALATMEQKPIVPLVLITRNPAQNCFLVVGLTCPNSPGEVHRNTLGTAFKLAAGETGANFRQDGFTSAVMEIQMDDIQYFIEQLHNVLDA